MAHPNTINTIWNLIFFFHLTLKLHANPKTVKMFWNWKNFQKISKWDMSSALSIRTETVLVWTAITHHSEFSRVTFVALLSRFEEGMLLFPLDKLVHGIVKSHYPLLEEHARTATSSQKNVQRFIIVALQVPSKLYCSLLSLLKIISHHCLQFN